jgi:hypothetical protein
LGSCAEKNVHNGKLKGDGVKSQTAGTASTALPPVLIMGWKVLHQSCVMKNFSTGNSPEIKAYVREIGHNALEQRFNNQEPGCEQR